MTTEHSCSCGPHRWVSSLLEAVSVGGQLLAEQCVSVRPSDAPSGAEGSAAGEVEAVLLARPPVVTLAALRGVAGPTLLGPRLLAFPPSSSLLI